MLTTLNHRPSRVRWFFSGRSAAVSGHSSLPGLRSGPLPSPVSEQFLTRLSPSEPELLRKQVSRFFSATFSTEPLAICLAPGRVNLIGEHVDYNGGLVLPFAIGLYTAIAIRPVAAPRIRARSQLDGTVWELALDSSTGEVWPVWTRYLQGTWQLWRDHTNCEPSGFDLAVLSTLPTGAGLSSSAALCVAFLSALQTLPGRSLAGHRTSARPPTQLSIWEQAQLCQQVEHQYAGVPCGLMDPLAVLASQRDHVLAIDFTSQKIESIPWPDRNLACLLIHTGVQHELAASEYGLRRADCEMAAEKLGVSSLRDAAHPTADDSESRLTEVERRRVRHVVSEIARTEAAIAACRSAEIARLGELLDASHRSLRDDYEVSCPELDFLATAVRKLPGVLGARMTGGGFGGSLIALLPTAEFDPLLLENLLAAYSAQFGLIPRWMLCQPVAGAIALNA